MRIGIIGAGKTGNSLARHFASEENPLSGFYSNTYEHSRQAADYVKSVAFLSLEDIVENSDMIFITTPDGVIGQVWKNIKKLDMDLKGKIFCHCSGSLSSALFEGIDQVGALGCAAHPMQAISSKYTDLTGAFFTLDGSPKAVAALEKILKAKGNPAGVIDPKYKGRYHSAASIASNLMIGLADIAVDQLAACGFSRENALEILAPLMQKNVEAICSEGPQNALTGPVERCDVKTVTTHLDSLPEEIGEIYRLISCKLLHIAQEKHPTRNYNTLREILEEKKQ